MNSHCLIKQNNSQHCISFPLKTKPFCSARKYDFMAFSNIRVLFLYWCPRNRTRKSGLPENSGFLSVMARRDLKETGSSEQQSSSAFEVDTKKVLVRKVILMRGVFPKPSHKRKQWSRKQKRKGSYWSPQFIFWDHAIVGKKISKTNQFILLICISFHKMSSAAVQITT